MRRHPSSIKVWDRPVRLLHWTLVIAVAGAWITTLGWGFVKWHEPAGYVALAAVTLRALWGFTGSKYARFRQFVRGPRSLLNYTDQLRTKSEPRHLGHNPLGGWMVLQLIACIAGLGITGWLYTTDYFWGMAWLDLLHQCLAWGLLALVLLHVAGVLFTSLRHRENLVAAMFTGRKRPPTSGGDTIV